MSRVGRKPKPTALKVLEGNPGKRPLNKEEPEVKSEKPACPKHLSKKAKAVWRKVAPLLEDAGIIAKLDGIALEMLCEAYAKWQTANESLDREGLVQVGPNGGFFQNPNLAIANRAMDQVKSFLAEFGMTPSERSRLKIDKKSKKQDDPWEGF